MVPVARLGYFGRVPETFFRVRQPEVTFEDFKKEILVIDLKTGHYHSLRDSATHIWRLLSNGHSVETAIPWLANFYGIEKAVLEPEAVAFISELAKQQLLVPDGGLPEVSALPSADSADETYTKPVMESYTDLQDLLLLDPIHEVNEAGWPHKKLDTA